MPTNPIQVRNLAIGRDAPLTIIAGPCLAESEAICRDIGKAMQQACEAAGFQYIFKASFDKANRSSIHSERGPGLDAGLARLAKVKAELNVPVTTDVHDASQPAQVAEVVDLLQIPAFLCRQTDLLVAAAVTGRAVNVKKGQFMAPQEMTNVISKLDEAVQQKDADQPAQIMLTERGTFFGYNRLTNDFVGLGDLMGLGCPVCFDVTHSTQQPGGQGQSSGGRPERASLLAKAAVAVGVDALFIETHPDPKAGLSDAATMLPLNETIALLPKLAAIRQAAV